MGQSIDNKHLIVLLLQTILYCYAYAQMHAALLAMTVDAQGKIAILVFP